MQISFWPGSGSKFTAPDLHCANSLPYILSCRSLLVEQAGSLISSANPEVSSYVRTYLIAVVLPLPGGDTSRNGLSCFANSSIMCFIIAVYRAGRNFPPL